MHANMQQGASGLFLSCSEGLAPGNAAPGPQASPGGADGDLLLAHQSTENRGQFRACLEHT